jgi:prevent-host-death family protein
MPTSLATTANTITSREFNQDRGKALKAAQRAPVYITNRGKPVYVLSTVEHFEDRPGAATKAKPVPTLLDLYLASPPGVGDIELELPKRRIWPTRELNLD